MIIVLIIAGMILIHRLNTQHDERIAVFRYGDALPGIGRWTRKSPRATGPEGSLADGTRREPDATRREPDATRREHREGSR
ncbi:hypothetical protein ABZV31_24885 [Streptomyces sp. NPDC005202]|uniref:hypothetical protein n=1 Tax=Streptomyces sp. NPDC005202 TaxID=3157021 RepID=UPI0033A6E82F